MFRWEIELEMKIFRITWKWMNKKIWSKTNGSCMWRGDAQMPSEEAKEVGYDEHFEKSEGIMPHEAYQVYNFR